MFPPCINLLLLSTILISSTVVTGSVLDLGSNCDGRSTVIKDVCISPTDPLITKKSIARTDIECLMGCQRNSSELFGCSAAYRDYTGNCYEISGDSSKLIKVNKDAGLSSGNLLEYKSFGDVNSCGGNGACRQGQICFGGCGGEEFDSHVCVADDRETCDIGQEYANARHYWSPTVSDGRDSGTVMTVTYPKKNTDSGIRVIIHMAVRGHYQAAGYCHHWYLQFNGAQCTNPANIEMLDYSATTGDFHRASDIDGTCYGMATGATLIELVIAPCVGYGSTDGYSGWSSARTMLIMEVSPIPSVSVNLNKPCPSSAMFNYQYTTWNEHKHENFDASATNKVIKQITYQKLASDTKLRIKYNALIALLIQDSGKYYCGRWFITIDGAECSPKAEVVIYQGSPDHYTYWRDHGRVRTIEGICDNTIAAGTHAIAVNIGNCYYANSQPTQYLSGGFNSPSRLHIEEVRKNHKTDAIYGSGGKMYRSMTAHLTQWTWYAMNNGADNAQLLQVTYTKRYASTGLRLTSNGDHRTIYNHASGFSTCGRWYFRIDGRDCGNPGVIEGVGYFNYYTNVHQPMQVSGICHGIAAGSRSITYHIGTCSGNTPTEAYTGWGSTFHIIAEELRVDLVKTCSGNPVNCGSSTLT